MPFDQLHALLAIDWQGLLLPALSVAEKIIRTLLVFVFLVIALRIAGRREIAQLNPFDFVVLLVLSNTLQNAVIGNDNSVSGGMVSAATLLFANWAVNRFMVAHPSLETLLNGTKRVLVAKGVVNEQALKRELITRQELEMAAHKQGIADPSEIESAEIDPDGELFFVAKAVSPKLSEQRQILKKLDQLTTEVELLRQELKRHVERP